jgi:hypothetical protein
MNLKSGRIEGFESYSQFKSVKDFNTHVEMWLAVNKQKFSKGEHVGLKRLVRFSVKVPGVCNAKIGTLLKAINEEYQGNGISRSTFKRMIIKARELGILTIQETERKNGSQSSNLYRTFVQLVKYFFTDAKTIEEYWHMVQIAAFRFECDQHTEDVLAVAIKTSKQLMRKLKSTKQVVKPITFFYGILTNKLKELYLDQLPENRFESKPLHCVLGNGEVIYYDRLHTES